MGVVSSRRRRRRRRSGKLRVFGRMACRNLQCVVRMLWHLHEPIFSYVNVSNLGAAHMILSAFYRLRHERLCVARWQVADLLRQEARFIECGTSASVSLDGRLHLFVFKHISSDVFLLARTNAHLSMRNLPERHEHFSVAGWHVADLLRRDANPMALRLSGMCVCHHDTPVHTEDTTSFAAIDIIASTVAAEAPTCDFDHEDGFTKLCVLNLEVHLQATCTRQRFMRLCIVWLDSELCSCARCGEFTLGRKMLQT